MAEASAATLVEYTREGQVAILTLNRPEKLNAFNDYLVRHLADALRRFDLDPKAQIAVICGSGRAFRSGAGVHQRRLRKREEFLEHGGPQGWGANSDPVRQLEACDRGAARLRYGPGPRYRPRMRSDRRCPRTPSFR